MAPYQTVVTIYPIELGRVWLFFLTVYWRDPC